MPRPERGATARGFRQQLLARLRNHAQREGVSAQRLQQRIAFERLLARLPISGEWTLKGGFALELRYGWTFRATQDIDLRTALTVNEALAALRASLADPPVPDHFSFEIARQAEVTTGLPDGGLRVPMLVRLAGVEFDRFHLDIASGDALIGAPDLLTGSAMLTFAAIEPIQFPAYPLTQQLAEKLHAYTLPRAEENTRVKDFVDLVAIASTESIQASALLASTQATFRHRGTHVIPQLLPAPPMAWTPSYTRLAGAFLQGPAATLDGGAHIATQFWEPLLSGRTAPSRWRPQKLTWESALGEAGPAGGHPHQPEQPE